MQSLSNWPGSVVDRCPQLPWTALTPLLFCGCVPTGEGLSSCALLLLKALPFSSGAPGLPRLCTLAMPNETF